MRTQSSKKNPELEIIRIEQFRKMSTSQRLSLTFKLSDTKIRLTKNALRRANPNLSENELKILFVKHCYGEELAVKFKEYLVKNNLW